MDLNTQADFTGREIPYSLEAEQTVIGSVLIDAATVLPVVIERLKPECFYNDKHKQIFNIMVRMFTNNETVDIITVGNEAYETGVFETSVMAKTYLKGLMENVPSISNIASYCKIIEDKFYLRSLIETARDIIDKASTTVDAENLLDIAEQKIYDIRKGKAANGLTRIDEIIIESYDRLQKISGPDKDKFLGVKTGFSLLDSYTTGLNKSDLIIVAARPGMGKSAFALNIARNMCKTSSKEVAIFSLEMGKEQLVSRMLSSESLVNNNSLRSGMLEVDDWAKLAEGAKSLSELPIYIDEAGSGITVSQMKAKLRRMKNLGLVIIDYLQLMESPNRHSNRVTEVSEITRQLKLMAKELDVPVICLSQLARGPENRTDHRPLLADLRESGSIEQDADIVMFLYREGYYDKMNPNQSDSECIIAKNRHGETGTIKLAWLGEYTLFRSIDVVRQEQ